jgi:hypothetical protein
MKKKDGQKCKIIESHDSSQQQPGQDQKSVKTINADHINSLVKPLKQVKSFSTRKFLSGKVMMM